MMVRNAHGVVVCLLVGATEVLASKNDNAAVGLLATTLVVVAILVVFLLVVFCCPMQCCKKAHEESDYPGVSHGHAEAAAELPKSPRGMLVSRTVKLNPREGTGLGVLCRGNNVLLVKPGSAADDGGLKPGHRVVSIAGEPLSENATTDEAVILFRKAAQQGTEFECVIKEMVAKKDSDDRRAVEFDSVPQPMLEQTGGTTGTTQQISREVSFKEEPKQGLQPGQRCEVRNFEEQDWLPATVERAEGRSLWACPDGWSKSSRWRYAREPRKHNMRVLSLNMSRKDSDESAPGFPRMTTPGGHEAEGIPEWASIMEPEQPVSKRTQAMHPPDGALTSSVYVKSQGAVPEDGGLMQLNSPNSSHSLSDIRMIASPNHAAPPPPPPLEKGAAVEAFFHGEWYDAVILATDTDENGQETYEVDWQDGTGTAGLTQEEIRHRPYHTNPRSAVSRVRRKWQVGSGVRALYHGVWYNAIIINALSGAYDVRFPDGSVACAVAETDLREPKT
eukprot:Hpha_TRINITY_DN16520_c0_g6::TRINITY_DN16520_c0_g6_i1::g.132781::m.132781